MSTQVINYQCPSCGGPLRFDSASGRLECDYCKSSFDVAEIEAMYAEREARAAEAAKDAEEKAKAWAAADASQWDISELQGDWGSEASGMKSYSCPSCGAELICDATTAATSCPYCGNPSVIQGRFAGDLKPDYVIPFKLTKEDAIKALQKFYGKKALLPREFSNKNHIAEVKGVYVPFWMFDGKAEGSVTFDATRVHTHKSGDYRITKTEHFDVHRSGELTFEKVPVDASTRMPDDYMDSIEPYDYSELKPFSAAYLPGFLADKYDVSAEDCFERADTRCKASFKKALADTATGYTSCVEKSCDIHLNRGKVRYALLPVWLLNTKWNDKDFLFAMNAQTGKLVGKLPVSVKRAFLLFAAIAVPLIAITAAFALWLVR